MVLFSDFAVLPDPPVPSDPSDAARVRQTRLRRRMLDGGHRGDVEQRRQRLMGSVRAAAHGDVDLSANPFRVINRERAVLYDRIPDIRHNAGELDALIGPGGAIDRGGLWAVMGRFQSYVLGCREYLMRVHIGDGVPRYRPVAPDLVMAHPTEDQPDRPVAIREYRLRRHPKSGQPIWTVDLLDISDAADPVYRVEEVRVDGKRGEDFSGAYLGGAFSGDAYPYRLADGTPVLPYVLFHAETLGDRLFDPYEEIELVEGSLNLAVLLSFWTHTMRDASWPQRYAVNCQPAGIGLADSDSGRRAEVITDPATVLLMEAIEEGMQPQIGQWSAGVDVSTMISAIDAYAVRLAQDAGVPPSDLQRLGGTARSGYAISLTNEGKRAQQRRYRLQFKRGDEALIALTAALLNRATGSAYPEEGYSVVHSQIPLSPTELREKRTHLLEIARAGLISRTRAYQELNPGITREQAERDLVIIAADRLGALT